MIESTLVEPGTSCAMKIGASRHSCQSREVLAQSLSIVLHIASFSKMNNVPRGTLLALAQLPRVLPQFKLEARSTFATTFDKKNSDILV